MKCPVCSAENGDFTPVCRKCGYALQPQVPLAPAQVVQTHFGVVEAIEVAVVIISACAYAYSRYQRISAEMLGFALGALVIPLVVGFLWGKAHKNTYWPSFVRAFVVAFVVAIFLQNAGRQRIGFTERDVPQILREAKGEVPLPVPDDPIRAIVRDYYRDLMLSANKSEAAQVSAAESANRPLWFTPASYADPQLETRIADGARELVAINRQRLNDMTEAESRFTSRIQDSRLSADEKATFLAGVAKTNPMAKVKHAIELRITYYQEVQALYEFAEQHRSDLRVVGDQLVIKNPELRDAINSKIRKVDELADSFNAASNEVDSVRQDASRRFNIPLDK